MRRPSTGAAWPRRRPCAPSCRPPRKRGDERGRDAGLREGRDRDRERHDVRARGAGSPPARPLPTRRSRPHGDAHRLRHRQLRRVHRSPGRRCGEELRGARRAGRRRRRDDGRGARRRGADAAPAVVLRPPRAPVRLLHAGDADERDGAARRESEPDRGGGQGGPPGQHLPLHGLLEHRRGRRGGREGAA